MIESPSGRWPEKAPRWDLTGIEGCGGGKVVSCPLMFLGYKSIYRRKKYVGGAPWGPQGWGCLPPWAGPPISWPPHGVPDFHSKSPALLSVQERSSRRLFLERKLPDGLGPHVRSQGRCSRGWGAPTPLGRTPYLVGPPWLLRRTSCTHIYRRTLKLPEQRIDRSSAARSLSSHRKPI